jgi:hypothetical protein
MRILFLICFFSMGLQAHAAFTGFPAKSLVLQVKNPSGQVSNPMAEPRILVTIACHQNLIDIAKRGYNECDVLGAVGFLQNGVIQLPPASANPGVPPTLSRYSVRIALAVNAPDINYQVIAQIDLTNERDIREFYNKIQTIQITGETISLR